MDRARHAAAAARATVRAFLTELGEDVDREGLLDTPERVTKAWLEMTSSEIGAEPSKAFGAALFNEPTVKAAPNAGVICVRDIAFASLSSTDLLPFHGRCHIMYAPANGTIVGLSKLARLVRLLSRRIQSQEELTWGLAEAVRREVAPEGVAVLVEARHLAAGPDRSQRATWAGLGEFASSSELNMELQLVMSLNGITPPRNQALAADGNFFSPVCEDASSFSRSQERTTDDAKLSALAESISGILVDLCHIAPSERLTAAAKNYARHMLAATWGYFQPLPVPCQEAPPPDDRRAPSRQGTPMQGLDTSSESSTRDFPEIQRLRSLCGSAQGHLPYESFWAPGPPEGPQSDDNSYTADMDTVPSEDSSGRWPLGRGHWLLNLPCSECEGFCFAFRSTCEHHLLPFYGDIFVAYKPGDSRLKLSHDQIEDLVNVFTLRLQVQERITHQVADALTGLVGPAGVLVVCQAAHSCMLARGAECHSGTTVTTAMRGRVGRVMAEAAQRALRERAMLQTCGATPVPLAGLEP